MNSKTCDISIVVTAHHEGTLAHRTMRSLQRAMEYAGDRGIRSEVIVVKDRASLDTHKYFAELDFLDVKLLDVDYGDLGPSRNAGTRAATGKYIAFLDADDLFSRHWLAKAFEYAEGLSTAEFVIHPRHTVLFEDAFCINEHPCSGSEQFRWSDMAEGNQWTACIFVPRELLLHDPFASTPLASGFGFEDWHWFCNVLARGVEIYTVDQTCVFIRRKRTGSLLMSHWDARAILPATPYLDVTTSARSGKEKADQRTRDKRREREVRWLPYLEEKSPRAHRLARVAFDVLSKLQSRKNRVSDLPDWLDRQWRDIHDVEPRLYPDAQSLRMYSWRRPCLSYVGEAYELLSQECESRPSHVFLIPALRRGGADLELLNYIKALVDHQLARGILVITTQPGDSPWANRLPNGVSLINFAEIAGKLFDAEKEMLLSMFLVQLQPAVIHNVNSLLGYRAFQIHGKALQSASRLFASVFCEVVSTDGKAFGYAYDELPFCIQYLTAVLCDNQRFLDVLHDKFAFDRAKLIAHHHPVDVANVSPDPGRSSDRLNILWASRLDWQKRPDLLADIAHACRELPFQFHVFGAPLLESDKRLVRRIKRLPNVTYRESFDGFESLEPGQFDVFLYTSQYDGMPNVVLEAMAAQLPIVAANVGGIHEIVTQEETGLLITPFDDVQRYVDALKRLHDDHVLRLRFAKQGRECVAAKHSKEQFVNAIQQVPGYTLGSGKK